MGWSMRIQTERGQPKGPDIYVPFDAIPFDREKYPTLSSVNPYYNTVLNPEQCVRFLTEWDSASSEPQYKEQARQWKIARDTAARCVNESLYLKFIGD
jgi:hypothetical protein